MNATTKLTRQGVRDLDFGWKKKPVAETAPEGTANDGDAQAQPGRGKDAAELPAATDSASPARPATGDVPAS